MSLFDTEFILNLNFAEFFENFELEQSTKFNDTDLDIVADFIRWALPEIKNSIAEGKAIFDFVDENIILNEVGVMPKNRSEGYFMIQDLKHDLLKIYKFEMSLFSTADNPLRTLKSKLVDLISLQTSEAYNPLDIKHNLIEKFPELQNPATYYFETSIDFPFVETILPVAKRKLVRTLAI